MEMGEGGRLLYVRDLNSSSKATLLYSTLLSRIFSVDLSQNDCPGLSLLPRIIFIV